MNKYFNIPIWLNWLLLPIVTFIAFWLANFAAGIVLFIVRSVNDFSNDSWMFGFHYSILQPAFAHYLAVLVAANFAPSHKFNTAVVVGSIAVLMNGGFAFMNLVIDYDPVLLVASLSAAVGAVGAIIQCKSDVP